ncbi:MAG: hypothetical protein JNM56_23575 [Planctomycetia bacterium]|nr:hypothetical protein [Planctomycetia bacterium]
MLRLVRRLMGLKVDREAAPEKKPEVLRRLQTSCVREVLQHEIKSGLWKLRT